MSVCLFVSFMVISLYSKILSWLFQVVQEYERAVIFRLGRLLSGGSRGPGKVENLLNCPSKLNLKQYYIKMETFAGIFFVLPCTDSYSKVDLRSRVFDIPPQEVSRSQLFCQLSNNLTKKRKEKCFTGITYHCLSLFFEKHWLNLLWADNSVSEKVVCLPSSLKMANLEPRR